MWEKRRLEGNMGNGTKVALVALLILMVVVIARFVRDDTTPADGAVALRGGAPATGAGKAIAKPDSTSKGKATAPSVAERKGTPQRSTAPSGSLATGSTRSTYANPGAGSKMIPPASGPAAPATGSEPSVAATGSSASAGTAPPAVGPGLPPPQGFFGPLKDSAPAGTGAKADAPDAGSGTGQGTPPVSIAAQQGQKSGQDPRQAADAPREKTIPDGGSSSPDGKSLALQNAGAGEKDRVPGAGAGASVIPGGDKAKLAEGYPKTHVIAEGDTYWGLAKTYYGRTSPALAAHIQKANADVKMRPKKKLTIPAPPQEVLLVQSTAKAGESDLKRTTNSGSREGGRPEKAPQAGTSAAQAVASAPQDYVVQEGDTLMKIAKKFYGDATLFHLIEDANGNLKYEMLRKGSRIHIPARK